MLSHCVTENKNTKTSHK